MEREQVREWRQKGDIDQVISLQRNGITQKDLDKAREDGYRDGYMYASEKFLRKMYAAIAQVLLDGGIKQEDVIQYVKRIDYRFAVMFDAEDEINAVFERIGVYFNVDRFSLDRVREVKQDAGEG